METWATVALVLGSNIIVALSTFFITKMQVRSSDRRFEEELKKAKEEAQHQRRWEVRSEPLLKLRNELAVMATKLEKLAKQGNAFVPAETEEQRKERLGKAEKDWRDYVAEDYLEKVLYSQFDTEIVNRVRDVRNEYLDTHSVVTTGEKEMSAVEFGKYARAVEEKIRPKVWEVQELINKRLEEL